MDGCILSVFYGTECRVLTRTLRFTMLWTILEMRLAGQRDREIRLEHYPIRVIRTNAVTIRTDVNHNRNIPARKLH